MNPTPSTEKKRVVANPSVTFDCAFAAARAAGADEFTWRGSRFHTMTAEELAAKSKPAPPLLEEGSAEYARHS